ncbi:hypothetical protein [Nocardioides albertanoniae]|uniref:hypothetical protein n=1 Tax=Nocardioides albertanoniae TaxID=1175486 RepID=UPI00114E7CC5|nr:hypothetical protein [Nocardioides albertanoniae]
MPQTTDSHSDQATNKAESIADLVAEADLIVRGTVTKAAPAIDDNDASTFEAQSATIAVDKVLKGDARPGNLEISKPDSAYYLTSEADPDGPARGRFAGTFVLKTESGTPTLFGYVGVHDDAYAPQAFARVLAHLPERRPAATTKQLSAWAKDADLIVYGSAFGDADHVTDRTPRLNLSDHASIEPIEVLKGDLGSNIDVAQGPQPSEPGGTWSFPIGKDDFLVGVYFIDTSGATPTVINTATPVGVNRRRVEKLL